MEEQVGNHAKDRFFELGKKYKTSGKTQDEVRAEVQALIQEESEKVAAGKKRQDYYVQLWRLFWDGYNLSWLAILLHLCGREK